MDVEDLRCDGFRVPVLVDGRSLFFPMRDICDILDINWRSEVLQLKPPHYAPIWLDARDLLPGAKGRMLCLRLDEFSKWASQFGYLDSACRTSRDMRHLAYRLDSTARVNSETGARRALMAPDVLLEVVRWHLQRYPSGEARKRRAAIESAFAASFGSGLADVTETDLQSALGVLFGILGKPEKRPITAYDELNELLERLVVAAGYGLADLTPRDVADVVISLEAALDDAVLGHLDGRSRYDGAWGSWRDDG